MPRFQVDVQKTFFGHFWTNRYFVTADTLAEAHSAATIFIAGEQAIHTSNVHIVKVRTAVPGAVDDTFLTEIVNVAGTLSTSGNGLPLFNVVRVDWSAGEGRPSRKFYRCLLGTGDVSTNFEWASGTLSDIEDALTTMRSDLGTLGVPLVDPDGEILGLPVPIATISMRQLRRGTRRQTEPII